MGTQVFVGIDVGKDVLFVAVRPFGDTLEIPNREDGIVDLVKRLRSLEPTLVVMEATAGYETPVAVALYRVGIPVVVSNPRLIRSFARATGRLAKTDKIDAGVIAHFAEVIRPAPRRMDEPDEARLGQLVTRRKQLLRMIVLKCGLEARAVPAFGLLSKFATLPRPQATVNKSASIHCNLFSCR